MANILICGVVRDCERHISNDIDLLSNAFSPEDTLHWLFIESDSSDNTIEELERLKNYYQNFIFYSLGNLRGDISSRTQRIARCRNHYLDLIRSGDYQDYNFKYIVIADFDGINNRITKAAITSCENRSDWDVCTANQSNRYYDIWALRHPAWSPMDCHEQFKSLQKIGYRPYKAYYLAIASKMTKISKESEWIQVESAFSGFALYKPHTLMNASYEGVTEQGEDLCEHVALHSKITASGYKIYINPQLITGTGNEHSRSTFIKLLLLLIFGGGGFDWIKGKARDLGFKF
ncbi:hypothetical protein FT643_17510 [Ketobacter sp. MCCC 1A13808]|uniref:hypothetical protein n=1 Tax=Ketobacter sp. MCCC 1A13808 TaxID=2602738 RepID=UPI0012EC2870|nr:hypothetical protein [Ketobacter sp. MCCC 1A13808]MVF13940.1 hypothetical protein [Ketobacter sp. MCCC 1A13808]